MLDVDERVTFEEIESVMVVVLAVLELSLEEEQFAAADEVTHLKKRFEQGLGFLDDCADIAEDLLTLDQIFEAEVAVKKMKVGLK